MAKLAKSGGRPLPKVVEDNVDRLEVDQWFFKLYLMNNLPLPGFAMAQP